MNRIHPFLPPSRLHPVKTPVYSLRETDNVAAKAAELRKRNASKLRIQGVTERRALDSDIA